MSVNSSRLFFVSLLALAAVSPGPSLAAPGMLIITSEPGGAKIYLNGASKGKTPVQQGKDLALQLPKGEYQLEAVLDGPRKMSATESVFVADDSMQPVHLALVPSPDMVRIPAGGFRMGCGTGAEECGDDEKPAHEVRVPAFEIGKYEVTFAEWDVCAADGGCTHKPDDEGWGRGERPVIKVSWDDAQQYVDWLSRKTGLAYRLPSEAEWEYAARAGMRTAYWWGDAISSNRANCRGCGSRWDNEKTAPVGSFAANPWGLHDVHGNVWEWVQDCWNDDYQGAPTDGSAWLRGDCGRRLLRGGSWDDLPRDLRAAYRDWLPAVYRYNFNGFRLARTLTP
jgi:formylglycine-generating enzyme required for sulfatase activity